MTQHQRPTRPLSFLQPSWSASCFAAHNAAEVERWYDDCGTVQLTLEQQFPGFEPEPEFWHFWPDADIRYRDSGYLDYQHCRMSEYVRRLRTPSENG